MSLLTSGQIRIWPIKIKTDLSLEELTRAAEADSYPIQSDHPSTGWGSSLDDDAMVGLPVISRITVGRPELFAEEGLMPQRLRLRYYWDRLDRRMMKSFGEIAAWDRLHVRQAIDVVIFDDETESGRTVLLSSRDHRLLTSAPYPALQVLGGELCSLETTMIAESIDPDLFSWLLWRLQSNPQLTPTIMLESIREMSSTDRQFRGARFTDDATIERIEMAALIVMGKARFGPAKLSFSVSDLKAVFELELYPDGGFQLLRASEYEESDLPDDLLGHQMVEDMWAVVLPRIREVFNNDTFWRRSGRGNLEQLAVQAIQDILPA